MRIKFNGAEQQALINALRVAADVFEQDIKTSAKEGHQGIADQFAKQEKETRALLDRVTDESESDFEDDDED